MCHRELDIWDWLAFLLLGVGAVLLAAAIFRALGV